MPVPILKKQPCKSLYDHKLGSNIFLPVTKIRAIPSKDRVTDAIGQKQVKLPCTMGILVLICACVFFSIDWFASDEVHELVKQ